MNSIVDMINEMYYVDIIEVFANSILIIFKASLYIWNS